MALGLEYSNLMLNFKLSLKQYKIMVAKLKSIANTLLSILIFVTVGSAIALLSAGYKEHGETCVYIMLGLAVPYYLLNYSDFK